MRAHGAVIVPLPTGDSTEPIRVSADDGDQMFVVIRRAQQGDVEAFELLYRAHAASVYALCRRMCGVDAEARELVQDVFVRAWEKLTSFRGESSFATWIHRLGVNIVLQHFRTTRRDAMRLLDEDAADAFAAHSSASSVDASIDLDRALAQLPAGARAVFVLHDIHGYSHDEIAQMTGIAAGTARAQLWRARRALTRLLDI